MVQRRIIATQEFVLMERYLWIESFAVDQSYRHRGFGKVMIERIKCIAASVKKIILLYSLGESIGFYLSCGFTASAKFPMQEGHHGIFMTYPDEK